MPSAQCPHSLARAGIIRYTGCMDWWSILLLIALPLAWGLAVEFLFEFVRRRQAARASQKGPDGRPV